jgi:riboflavin synthase
VAIQETMNRTNLSDLKIGDKLNLERAATIGHRLDGHLVQGHVDAVGVCSHIEVLDGSWYFKFAYPAQYAALLIDKGSVCISGVSLTVIAPTLTEFSVAIIPYTYENTIFHALQVGSRINLEFDIIGKYLLRHREVYPSR